MKCVVDTCETEVAQSRVIDAAENDLSGSRTKLVVKICDSCLSELSGKRVNMSFYRCGRLKFVEHIIPC